MSERLRKIGRLSNYGGGWFDRVAARIRLPLDRIYNGRILPDIRKVTEALPEPASRNGDGRPHVVIASLRVWPNHALTEVMIGKALEARGVRVTLLTCGGALPICEIGWRRKSHPRPCDRCAHFTEQVADTSGFEHRRLADYVPWGNSAQQAPRSYEEIVERPSMDYDKAGSQTAAWVLKTTSPETVAEGPEVLRDSAVTAAACELATNKLIDELDPDIFFLVNGILVEEHVIAKVARARGKRAVTYGFGIHENSIVMSSDVLPALDFKNEPLWHEARETPLTDEENKLLDQLLLSREQGAGTQQFFTRSSRDPAIVRSELGIPEGKRLISMFTNITWDSACLNKDIAFPNADEWIRHAVRVANANSDIHLVIRVHPAEVSLGTLEPAEGAVAHEFPELPPNVRFISADEQVNSYALADASEMILVYSSTTGLESAVRGQQVVVAGDVHYRGRGFTTDLDQPEDLTLVMEQGPRPLDEQQVELARRYAYAYFLRLMTPLPKMWKQTSYAFAKIEGESVTVEQGSDPFLDLICDRILDGQPLSTPRALVTSPTPFPDL